MTTQSKTTWRKTKLGEWLEFKYGFGLPEKARKKGDVPVYGSSGIIGWHNEPKVKGSGIIIGRKGNVGAVYFSEKAFYPIDTVYFVDSLKKGGDLKFFYYLLKTINFQKVDINVGVPGLNRETALSLKVFIPENQHEQKRIASILSAFDEKIEVNNKINKILEEMAQAIFKRWFIEFKFPGWEKVKFVDSELGKIPEGWEIGYLGDGVLTKIIPSGIEKFEGEKIYLATADVSGKEIINTTTKITFNKRPSRANMQPRLNSVWFAKMINTYKVLFFFEGNKEDVKKFILSTGFMGVECLRNSHFYIYLIIASKRFHQIKDTLVQGAVQEAVTVENIKRVKLLLPSEKILNEFNKKIEPLFIKIYKNKVESQTLSSLRDLLLPKLMSGEIRV